MSAFERQLVSDIADAFGEGGHVRSLEYRASQAAPWETARGLLDRSVEQFGPDQQFLGRADVVTLITEDLLVAPQRGGQVRADGITWTLTSLLVDDDAAMKWQVARAAA